MIFTVSPSEISEIEIVSVSCSLLSGLFESLLACVSFSSELLACVSLLAELLFEFLLFEFSLSEA